jgi:hypothetical protein
MRTNKFTNGQTTQGRKEALKKAKAERRKDQTERNRKMDEFRQLTPEEIIKRNIEERKAKEAQKKEIEKRYNDLKNEDISKYPQSSNNRKITKDQIFRIVKETLIAGEYLNPNDERLIDVSEEIKINAKSAAIISQDTARLAFPDKYNFDHSLVPGYSRDIIEALKRFEDIISK